MYRGFTFVDGEALTISLGLIFVVARYVMLRSSMISEGKNKFSQNYERCTN